MSSPLAALLWGALASSSLIIGSLIVLRRPPSRTTLGLVMGFGAGVLLSAVSFELVEEAVVTAGGTGALAAGLAGGALVFFAGDLLISRAAGAKEGSSALPIVLGIVLDGVPESAVLGLTLVQTGEVGASMLVAVFVSNVPEAIAASSDLLAEGWTRRRLLTLWGAVAAVTATAAMAGYALLADASPWSLAFIFAFAGGAILAMVATSMMPEAYERAGRPVGLMVTAGYALSFGITWVAA